MSRPLRPGWELDLLRDQLALAGQEQAVEPLTFLSRDWLDWRWQHFPPSGREDGIRLGERAFAAIRAAGRTPSLLQVSWRPGSREWQPGWQKPIRRLRPLLPSDAFPFGVIRGLCCFLTGELEQPAALERMATALCSSVRRSREGRRSRVLACLADDERSLEQVRKLLADAGLAGDRDARLGVAVPPVVVLRASRLDARP